MHVKAVAQAKLEPVDGATDIDNDDDFEEEDDPNDSDYIDEDADFNGIDVPNDFMKAISV